MARQGKTDEAACSQARRGVDTHHDRRLSFDAGDHESIQWGAFLHRAEHGAELFGGREFGLLRDPRSTCTDQRRRDTQRPTGVRGADHQSQRRAANQFTIVRHALAHLGQHTPGQPVPQHGGDLAQVGRGQWAFKLQHQCLRRASFKAQHQQCALFAEGLEIEPREPDIIQGTRYREAHLLGQR